MLASILAGVYCAVSLTAIVVCGLAPVSECIREIREARKAGRKG